MSEQNDSPQKRTIQVQIDETTAKGTYANLVMVSHTENEFVFDFVFVQPTQNQAKVQSRIVLSPRQAKRLGGTLAEAVGRYEGRFGEIPAPVDTSTSTQH